MLRTAATRGFRPDLVGFDSWYASLSNLKLVRDLQWLWLTQLKANRLVDPAHTGNQPIRDILIPRHGAIVHLKGYGLIKVFKIAAPNGSIEFWATSDLTMTVERCADEALRLWQIEGFHRSLKQFRGIARATSLRHDSMPPNGPVCAWGAVAYEPVCQVVRGQDGYCVWRGLIDSTTACHNCQLRNF